MCSQSPHDKAVVARCAQERTVWPLPPIPVQVRGDSRGSIGAHNWDRPCQPEKVECSTYDNHDSKEPRPSRRGFCKPRGKLAPLRYGLPFIPALLGGAFWQAFVKYRGYRCFKNSWAGFDTLKPINVLIGRNNTEKSHLLDFAESLCGKTPSRKGWQCSCEGILDEASLRQHFQAGTSGGPLPGDHWGVHGHHFIGLKITWRVDENGQVAELILPSPFDDAPSNQSALIAQKERIVRIAQHATHQLTGCHFRRLFADRDIQP